MAQVFPTKGNLLNLQKSLSLAKLGYDLLDRKRNILVREMMGLISSAEKIQEQINDTYVEAYSALQNANVTLGLISDTAAAMPIDDNIRIDYRSVMGVEIPIIRLEEETPLPKYSMTTSNSRLDAAYIAFIRVKHLTAQLAEVETSVYRLASAVKKTQKRSNALRNIIIPDFENNIRFIVNTLSEREREEFSRMKVMKPKNNAGG